jgi:alpha-L-rhamnosidase
MSVTWSAAMISPTAELDGAPVLRRQLDLDEGHGEVASAALHVSSLGIFEASLNGEPVDDDVLSPGWSSYEWRLRYRTYDVRALVRPHTVIEVALGNGWHRGHLGWQRRSAIYGDRLGLIAQLDITFADGHRQLVVTDDRWAAHRSATTANDLYDGQTIDARHRSGEGRADDEVGVEIIDFDLARLTPYVGPPVRRQESLAPVRIWSSPSGRTLVDFGQNLVGWLRLRARGESGDTITVRHAEVLEHDELGVRPLRTAKATDRFILSGGDDVFEPTMTFHGFRYAEVDGYPGELTADALDAVVVHSDLVRTGRFSCSDDLLDQLHSNVVWGLRGNFLDVPTDCPQRDERLGWTGDLAVFSPTAAFLYDVQAFLADWLLDLAVEQEAQDGRVPFIVPDMLKYLDPQDSGLEAAASTAVWGDVAVWTPWALWIAYGDRSILEAAYPSMAAHVRRVASMVSPSGLWDQGFQFGDWLDPDAPTEQPWKAKADRGVVATACFYRSVTMVAEAARIIGRDGDAAELEDLAARTGKAFNDHYVCEDGTITSDAVTAYALAIVFGLLDPEAAQRAGTRLAELVAANGYRVATGFAGTPFVTDALTITGHVDDAYRLLLERSSPSWLYTVTMGATTIWERWDSMLPDGSINPGEMTSFNHYALGAVADWMHRTIGGIAPLEPGYQRVLVAPRPGGGLSWATTSLDTRHGLVEVAWRQDGADLTVEVTLPDGVTGVLDLAGQLPVDLPSGRSEHRGP